MTFVLIRKYKNVKRVSASSLFNPVKKQAFSYMVVKLMKFIGLVTANNVGNVVNKTVS